MGARGRVLLWLQLCGKGVGGWRAGGPTHPETRVPEGCAAGARGAAKAGRPPGPSLRSARGAEREAPRSRRARPMAGRARPPPLPPPRSWPPAPGGAPLTPAWPVGGGASSERPPTPRSCENCSPSPFPSLSPGQIRPAARPRPVPQFLPLGRGLPAPMASVLWLPPFWQGELGAGKEAILGR